MLPKFVEDKLHLALQAFCGSARPRCLTEGEPASARSRSASGSEKVRSRCAQAVDRAGALERLMRVFRLPVRDRLVASPVVRPATFSLLRIGGTSG
jgi:hypothetical protein